MKTLPIILLSALVPGISLLPVDLHLKNAENMPPQALSWGIFSLPILDTISIDEVQIDRGPVSPGVLQTQEFVKKAIGKKKAWQSVFMDKSGSGVRSAIPNRANTSTSSLISVDVLSIIGLLSKRKKSPGEDTIDMAKWEQYIEHHFDTLLVKRVTGFSGPSLIHFHSVYRPMAADLDDTTTYALIKHIKKMQSWP